GAQPGLLGIGRDDCCSRLAPSALVTEDRQWVTIRFGGNSPVAGHRSSQVAWPPHTAAWGGMTAFDDDEFATTSRVEPHRTNYVGAIYGSLLAASVVAGTSPLNGAPKLGELVALIFVTGLVFWAAHV